MDKEHYQHIIEKYLSGNCTAAEVTELVNWIKQDADLQVWLQSEIQRSDSAMAPELQQRLFERIKQATQQDESDADLSASHRFLIPNTVWRWVAMICLPLCIAFTAFYLLKPSAPDSLLAYTIKAERGNRTSVYLPDGTEVILNSSSRLSYTADYGSRQRRVDLNGEAFFRVKHNERQPFVVHTGSMDVKVLGTTFNVSAYEDTPDVSVVLLEGKVGLFARGFEYTMKPGEKVDYDKRRGTHLVSDVFATDYVQWTKGNLYFEKESLKNIMKTLSRVYNIDIRFDSSKLPNEYFSGTIPNGSIQSALDILMLTTHFHYVMTEKGILIKDN